MSLTRNPEEETGLSQEFLDKIRDQAEQEILQRSGLRVTAYFALFLVILWVTPIARRSQGWLMPFGIALATLTALRAWQSWRRDRFLQWPTRIRKLLFTGGILASAALWGISCAAVVAFFELGWTSFFCILVTCAICAGEMAALSPRFRLLCHYLAWMLLPTALAHFLLVGGLRGNAIGVFFLGYFGLLTLLGRVQFIEYWSRLRETARMKAMIDAIPGTVAWVKNDLTYLGVNRTLAEQWNLDPSDFQGKTIGFSNAGSPMIPFARSLFESSDRSRATEAQRAVRGEIRDYYLFGQKYNHGTEAILLGLDITSQREGLEQTTRERALRFMTARSAAFGRAFSRLVPALRATIGGDSIAADAPRLIRVLESISSSSTIPEMRPLKVVDLLEDVKICANAYAREKQVDLNVVASDRGGKIEGDPGQLYEILLTILNESFDSVSETPERWVKIEAQREGGVCVIRVLDSRTLAPSDPGDRIFDPLFTQEEAGSGSGFGLHMTRELVELHRGSIEVDFATHPARTVLRFPSIAE